MIQTAVSDPVSPAVRGRKWSLNQIGERFHSAELAYDGVGEPFHGDDVAIIATHSQQGCRVNRDRIIEPDGDYAYMDVETLKRLMDENGESQSGLARMLDITRDKFHKVIKGKRRLTVEEADKLSRYFGLLPEPEEPRRIPIIGLVSAGVWREAVEQPRGWMPSPDKALSEYAFAVIVEGDSMNEVAQEGEVIIVDPADLSLVDGKFYIVRNEEGETTFKQYRHHPPRLEPCSSNKEHHTIYPGRDVFTIVGRARKKVSDL